MNHFLLRFLYLLVFPSLLPTLACSDSTLLREYFAKEEPAYHWELKERKRSNGYTYYLIDLSSLSWHYPKVGPTPSWHHWLQIVEPDGLERSEAFLMIAGGSSSSPPPLEPQQNYIDLATQSRALICQISSVPNQPLLFDGDDDPRYKERGRNEDALVAYSWQRFLDEGDPTWIAQFPIAKSVVKAMNAIQEVASSILSKPHQIETFILSGKSKRGWAAWNAALDPRVQGIIPLVIDMLNMGDSLAHHHRASGSWSFALRDFEEMGILDRWPRKELGAIFSSIDPFCQRDELLIPKLMINSASDEFFLPDSSQFYFSELKGIKYLRYIPNAGHTLHGSDYFRSISAFSIALMTGAPLPKLTWTKSPDGSLLLKTEDAPLQVRAWRGYNPTRRSFQFSTEGPLWIAEALNPSPDGTYFAPANHPPTGWSGLFIEATYPGPMGLHHTFTTEVVITPST